MSKRESRDDALLRAFLRRRDEVSFRALYRYHTPTVYPVVYRLLGRAADVDDVVQDTWLRALERLDSFRGDSSFRTWLTGIAINRCRESFRRTERDRREPAPATGAAATERHDARVDAGLALARIPERYRVVVVLHELAGFDHDEIASLLGIAPSSSRSRLTRARRLLRERLGLDDGRRKS